MPTAQVTAQPGYSGDDSITKTSLQHLHVDKPGSRTHTIIQHLESNAARPDLMFLSQEQAPRGLDQVRQRSQRPVPIRAEPIPRPATME